MDRQRAEPTPPIVLSFPADDAVLRERIAELIEDATPDDAANLAEMLERAVRIIYPQASVRLQHALAGFGQPTLYVFRDGGATSDLDPAEWATDATCACVVTDAAGIYVDANEAATALFGVAREQIVGKPAGTFTRPDARIKRAEKLWSLLAGSGRLHSLAVVSRADGTDVRVEFVTVKDQARPGLSVTTMRPVA